MEVGASGDSRRLGARNAWTASHAAKRPECQAGGADRQWSGGDGAAQGILCRVRMRGGYRAIVKLSLPARPLAYVSIANVRARMLHPEPRSRVPCSPRRVNRVRYVEEWSGQDVAGYDDKPATFYFPQPFCARPN